MIVPFHLQIEYFGLSGAGRRNQKFVQQFENVCADGTQLFFNLGNADRQGRRREVETAYDFSILANAGDMFCVSLALFFVLDA